MVCSCLAPVPLPRAAGKHLGVFERRMAFDLYVLPHESCKIRGDLSSAWFMFLTRKSEDVSHST